MQNKTKINQNNRTEPKKRTSGNRIREKSGERMERGGLGAGGRRAKNKRNNH